MTPTEACRLRPVLAVRSRHRLLLLLLLLAAACGLPGDRPAGDTVMWELPSAPANGPRDPQLPRALVDTRYTAPMGATHTVRAGDNLQAALDAAQPGDVLLLEAGASFTGNFTLRPKGGSGWIVIRSSAADANLPRAGTRMTPAFTAALPRLVSPNAEPALRTAPRAHHYRLIGIEATVAPEVTMSYGIVALGDGSRAQNSLDDVPHHLVLDRVYVHGHPALNVRRCVAFNSAWSAVIDSYLAACHAQGFDSQAIGGWNGPGPFKIVNNYLEGAGETVMFGGADPAIQGLVPSDIEVRRNHFYKPLAWKGIWTVKNHFELKNGRRVLLEANVLENCWVSGQSGNLILTQALTDNNTAAWVTVQDVTIRNNWLTNAPQGATIASRVAYEGSGRPPLMPSQPSQRIAFTNNVFDRIGYDPALGTPGHLLALFGDLQYITVAHNSGVTQHVTLVFDGNPQSGLVMRDNVFARGRYGVLGSGTGEGTAALTTYAPGYRFEGNVIFGNSAGGATPSAYPPNNTFPATPDAVGFVNYAASDYTLAPSSPFRGTATDGSDPGANIPTLRSAISGITQ